jgi:phosphate transport system permease protein
VLRISTGLVAALVALGAVATLGTVAFVTVAFVAAPGAAPAPISSLVYTLSLVLGALCIAAPLALGAALYLEEYAPNHWVTRSLGANIDELARLPGILWGILALALFVRVLSIDRPGVVVALTLGLIGLPRLTRGLRVALRSVAGPEREAVWALGATRWQVIRSHVLPLARRPIAAAFFATASRLVGETAPLLLVAAFSAPGLTSGAGTGAPQVLAIETFSAFFGPGGARMAGAGVALLLATALALRAIGVACDRDWSDH